MVTHDEAPPQVKIAYINFLIHCYLETEVEVKEIHHSAYVWHLFKSFVRDISLFCSDEYDMSERFFNQYIQECVISAVFLYFKMYADNIILALSEAKVNELIVIIEALVRLAEKFKQRSVNTFKLVSTLRMLQQLVTERDIKLMPDLEAKFLLLINQKKAVTTGKYFAFYLCVCVCVCE